MARFIPHFALANLMDAHEVEWDVSTVNDLIEMGRKQYGDNFVKEVKRATILVNGRAVSYLNGLKTALSSTDEIWTVLPSAGG